jgi:class 3 adenylate cyclase/tetratricopeptide (TPR) repeat protein
MECPGCQAENREGARFCRECGATFGTLCSSCGVRVEAGSKFCDGCGARLATGPAPATAPPRFSSPNAYTPKHLAEKILTSKAALEGERKQVTVLFADLKGSMELLADRDPEEARKLLDPILEHMMEAVHRYEGTVNQVMGDGIMALFGAPLAHEDHAVRASYAALRMQESVKRYAEEVRRAQGVTVRIRVGLNSGEVVVRAIGSDLHMDYTAVGLTTHLAARMEQLAEPGSILLTPATLRLAEGYVAVEPRGPLSVKGLPEPVEVYELSGARAVGSRFHVAAARGLTRFVGRDSELDQLRQALERAQAGHGQVVAVVGEPGVGKSRLCWEFTHSHRTQGWLLLESGSVSYGKATAYLPVIELLKAYFHIEGRDEARTIRETVTGKILALARALEPSLPALLSLLEVPVEDAVWGRLDPPQRRQRTLDAVKRLLLRESQVQPLLLLVEDLHWIDAETQALLDNLVESLPTARLLLLATYRPEYQHQWESRTYYRQLRIDPLPAESADDLLTSVLGTHTSLGALKRVLIDRTEGNPLFLEESVRTLAETKTLMGERGAYRLAHDATAIQVPATVQTILAARIDRLPQEDKRLLQVAAVIDKDVPFALLLAVADLGEEDLRRGLAHLQAAEFLYEASLFPDLEYTFKHALTQEVAYASLLEDQRRPLHARILHVIERVYSSGLDDKVAALAHHAFEGARWQEAVGYLHRAGMRAIARSANTEAAACFQHALAALSHLPDRRENQELAIDLRFGLRNALTPLGQVERTLECLGEAEKLAGLLGDNRRRGRALSFAANCLCIMADYEGAIEASQRARQHAKSLGDFPLSVAAGMYLGRASAGLGQYQRAADVFREVAESLSGARNYDYLGLPVLPAVFARSQLVLALAELGEFDEAERFITEAIEMAESTRHPDTLLWAYVGAGRARLVHGDLPPATSALEHALELCRTADIPVYFPLINSPLGLAYAMGGRVPEGLVLVEQAVEQTESKRQAALLAWSLLRLGEVRLLADQPSAAAAAASRALALFREHKDQGGEAYALRSSGEVEGRHGNPGRATLLAQQAHSLAQNLGMKPLAARCQLLLATLRTPAEPGPDAAAHPAASPSSAQHPVP